MAALWGCGVAATGSHPSALSAQAGTVVKRR